MTRPMKPLLHAQHTAAPGELLSPQDGQSWRSMADTVGSLGDPVRVGGAAAGAAGTHGACAAAETGGGPVVGPANATE